MITDRKQTLPTETANQLPINLAAASFLKETDWGARPNNLHLVNLMLRGMENGLRLPTISEAPDWVIRLNERHGQIQWHYAGHYAVRSA